jgi:2-amino-4-hydroxy-6-hydroxymethyldihydropteridine diphosphokinase
MTVALVALGSNLEPRRRHLLGAVAELAQLPRTQVLATSTLIETPPIGCPPGSPPFLNGACLLETELSPRALLAGLQSIEAAHGRRPGAPRNAPRTLDLDLVLHGSAVLDAPELTLPHPRAHERLFVLEPAAEIAPALRHPRLDRTLAQLRDQARARAATSAAEGAAGGDACAS